MFGKIRFPSPSMTVSWIALGVALGGTAVAATTTLVTLTDKSGTRFAIVDFLGRLRTTAAPTPPATMFSSLAFLGSASGVTFLGPSTASVVVTNINMGNYFDQTNGAGMRFAVYWVSGPAADCSNATYVHNIGYYMAKAGETAQVTFPVGFNLKPKAAGDKWCLKVAYSVQGNPSTYYLPDFGVIGYVDSGSFTVPFAASASAATPPRNH